MLVLGLPLNFLFSEMFPFTECHPIGGLLMNAGPREKRNLVSILCNRKRRAVVEELVEIIAYTYAIKIIKISDNKYLQDYFIVFIK